MITETDKEDVEDSLSVVHLEQKYGIYITPVYVDTIKILRAYILYLPFYSKPLFYITQSFSKKF